MNDVTPVSTLVLASVMALSGLAYGLAYFQMLRRTADLVVGGCGWLGPAGLTLSRIAGAVVLLSFMTGLGAVPLLAGFLGFLVARAIGLHSE